MEKWQESIIRVNRPRLINITKCTPQLITTLAAKGILSKDDTEALDVTLSQKGKMAQSNLFYDIVTTKDNGFNVLIEVFIDPELAQIAVAKLLIQETKCAGNRIYIPEISSVPIQNDVNRPHPTLAEFQDNNIPEQNQRSTITLPKELEDFVCNGKELDVQVKTPDCKTPSEKSNYLLPPKGLGYAFILNIIEIEGQDTREGAEKDTDYMVKLLEGLGYKIFPQKKSMLYSLTWNKEVIQRELQKFKEVCIQFAVDSIVVFFGSHGYKDHLLTSDGELLDVQADIIYPLQFGKALLGKSVAKIFIDQTCRIDPPYSVPTPAPLPTCEDTLHIQAQMPKYEANRDADCGSYFVIVLVYVLMTKACDTPLQKMLEETQDLLKRMSLRAGADMFQLNPFTMGLSGHFYFFTR
ncbi:unnamed protein product [Orchesella dallaii]|uniref:Uncharacterized protein n=1 Tax=Orchesella dallaii TaxID=48710 RepID=A0ABP1RJ08_9HEXA